MRSARTLLFAIPATLGVIYGLSSVVSAQSVSGPTGDQVAFIRSNCGSLKETLNRVHVNDGLARVNHGRLYEQLSTKLMAPFNSRVASNRLDGASLLSMTSTYERHVEEFRSVYQRYDVSVAAILKISCVDEPTRFYEELQQAQRLRAEVYASVKTIGQDIIQYQEAFDVFRANFAKVSST